MSNYIRFDRRDIQALIGLLDACESLTEREEILKEKAIQIASLQSTPRDEYQQPSLYRDQETGRLTIQQGDKVSDPVSFKGVARLGNYFAVTEAWLGSFPTNQLLRWFHVSKEDKELYLEQVSAGGRQ